MIDLTNSWVRFRTLPDHLLDELPEHVRATFRAAERAGFEVEMLGAGVHPPRRRARRRFVLVADDAGNGASEGGPLNFDLAAVATDVRAANRLFVLASRSSANLHVAAYAAAVEDLESGFDVAMVVETRPPLALSWARTLAALREGATLQQQPGPRRRARHCACPRHALN